MSNKFVGGGHECSLWLFSHAVCSARRLVTVCVARSRNCGVTFEIWKKVNKKKRKKCEKCWWSDTTMRERERFLHNTLCRLKTATTEGNISKRNQKLRSDLLPAKRLTFSLESSSSSSSSSSSNTHNATRGSNFAVVGQIGDRNGK